MYGGYYANLWINEKHTGIHTETYKELKQELEKYNLKPVKERRWDN